MEGAPIAGEEPDASAPAAPNPLCQLPSEILGDIFCAYVDSIATEKHLEIWSALPCWDAPSLKYVRIRIARDQNLLLYVCRLWTDIVLSTPQYWRLVVLWHPSKECSLEERADHWGRFRERTARAGSIDLTVLYMVDHVMDPSDKVEGLLLLDEFSTRMSSAVITTLCSFELDGSYRIAEASQSRLRRLMIGGSHKDTVKDLARRLNDFQDLRFLSISPIFVEFLDIPLVSATLVRLHLCLKVDHDIMAQTLLDMPQLLHLRTDINRSGTKPIVHSQLKSLVLISSSSISRDFLSLSTFPALRRLELSINGNDPEWPKPEDLAFFERSACPLEYLSVRGSVRIQDFLSDFLYYLSATIKVVALLCTAAMPSAFLEELSKASPVRTPIPPCIEEFGFPNIPSSQRGRLREAFIGIAALRDAYGLRRVKLDPYLRRNITMRMAIRRLEECGIVVRDCADSFDN
ncbi:hypothetical protein CYLTODRAFT_490411 [Cylindrobasidium torrendii FP15055 ss-10]|uniref:F-box domain-containing protein n=1 Tax=Cylindrobasidium torrendii FP15055 ss-10 TaxID=1314674 RepID=A0A0D7BBW6_9AGAR|nr:hypothetical protein CYLTODRAFT_490411 [Cylindrobasidium torrendii FP15055 ss-10]